MSDRSFEMEVAGRRWLEHDVEERMLTALSEAVGRRLVPVMLTVDGSIRFEVEGCDADGTIFCQFVANQGIFKSHHRNRVSANLFKLAWLTAAVRPGSRAVLCITETATQAFTSSGWATAAARDLKIEIYVFKGDRATPLFAPSVPADDLPL